MTNAAQPVSNGSGSGRARRGVLIWLSSATHRRLRLRAAEEGTSIQRWVAALLERELGFSGQPVPPLRDVFGVSPLLGSNVDASSGRQAPEGRDTAIADSRKESPGSGAPSIRGRAKLVSQDRGNLGEQNGNLAAGGVPHDAPVDAEIGVH